MLRQLPRVRFMIETMWLWWISVLIFTAELGVSDATVYGSINESPEDVGHGSVDRIPSSPSGLDFVDTRSGFGSRESEEAPTKHIDLFSQLKHLQLPTNRGHHLEGGMHDEPRPATESDMANVRRSLATVLQVLLPYGHVQRVSEGGEHDDDRSSALGDDGSDYSSLGGGGLLPDGPETANYMLHGKLVEIGPRRHGPTNSPQPNSYDDAITAVGSKRAAALRTTVARRSHGLASGSGAGEEGSFLPSISVGALTNLGDFFQNLKHNLESLESKHLNTEQVKLLEGQNMISSLRKEFAGDYPKPGGSAAFLHAIRNYRPSHRIRALVSTVPELYRGTNFHDPVYMLAGLGK